MGTIIKPNDFTASTTIDSSDVNDNFDTIYDEFNGNITAANLATNAVATAKIADSAVTTAKINDGAVTVAKVTMPYKFYVYRSAASNSSNSLTVVPFDTKVFDIGTNVDVVTNKGRFTAPVTGHYWFSAGVGNTVAAGFVSVQLMKNGSSVTQLQTFVVGSQSGSGSVHSGSTLIALTAADYVEIGFIGGSGSVIQVGQGACWFTGHLVSV